MSIIAWLKTLIYGPDSIDSSENTNHAIDNQLETVNTKTISLSNEAKIGSNAEPGNANKQLDQGEQGLGQEQVIWGCIQSSFRVINESIEIARRSKNCETKLSRIALARKSLEEAQNMAESYRLKVEGFANADAEIKRIEQAIDSETPTITDDMPNIGVDSVFSSDARKLLMEATDLKKLGKYLEACDKLKQAYSANGAKELFIEERLRLPMYLLLAGKEKEGLASLNRLATEFNDPMSQAVIAKQKIIFQKKASKEKAPNLKTVKKIQTLPENPVIKPSSGSYKAWKGNQDIVEGLQFCATLQLRTPMRVLVRHGETHTDINEQPPKIALEAWEGDWVPQIQSLEEILGVKMGNPPPENHSTDIGPLLPSKYLPFLTAVRKIVELEEPMQSRLDKLRNMLTTCEWQVFVEKHGGTESIIQKLFPRTIRPMPKFNDNVKKELATLGLETPQQLATVGDKQLLSIKGIGPTKLKAIREHCFDMEKDRDDGREDQIVR